MPLQGGTAPPAMLRDIFQKHAGVLPNYAATRSPISPTTEPGSVRPLTTGGGTALPPGLQNYAQQGQQFLDALKPQVLPAAPSNPLTRTAVSPGLVNPNSRTKTPANVQAILRRLLAPQSMLPNYY